MLMRMLESTYGHHTDIEEDTRSCAGTDECYWNLHRVDEAGGMDTR